MFSPAEYRFLKELLDDDPISFTTNYQTVLKSRIKKRLSDFIVELKTIHQVALKTGVFKEELVSIHNTIGGIITPMKELIEQNQADQSNLYERQVWIIQWRDYLRNIALTQNTLSLGELLHRLVDKQEILGMSTRHEFPINQIKSE